MNRNTFRSARSSAEVTSSSNFRFSFHSGQLLFNRQCVIWRAFSITRFFFLFFLFFFFFFLVLRGAFRDDPNLDDDCVTSVPNENKSP